MKKKEFLVIFVLAVFVTGLSFGYEHQEPSGCCGVWLEKNVRGLPLPFALSGPSANEGVIYLLGLHFPGLQISLFGFIANTLFWFLVLVGGWWVVKKLKTKK